MSDERTDLKMRPYLSIFEAGILWDHWLSSVSDVSADRDFEKKRDVFIAGAGRGYEFRVNEEKQRMSEKQVGTPTPISVEEINCTKITWQYSRDGQIWEKVQIWQCGKMIAEKETSIGVEGSPGPKGSLAENKAG